MATAALRRETPPTPEDAAALLRACGESGDAVRIVGGATKLGWGRPSDARVELCTRGLDALVEHNRGDLTAVVQAGMPLADLAAALGEADQMLALDPPLGDGDAATVGGVLATADSGPLRHRYGGPRDLVLGVTVALGDGTLARAGGKVIKNVAGYDLAKLFTGAFGTLGLIVQVAVRLHPRPPATATVTGATGDPAALAAAAAHLAHSPLEMQSLDVRWEAGTGTVLAGFAGATAADQAGPARRALADAGLRTGLADDDAALWERQRAAQRADGAGAVVRVSGRASALAGACAAAQAEGATLVGRAALGVSWIALPPGPAPELAAAVGRLRAALAPAPCVVLDAPEAVRAALDPWDEPEGPALGLMRRVKARFDPARTCNPGVYVGGI